MPVKEYKTRYVVFEVKNREELIKTLKNAQNLQSGFRFKIVREYNGLVVVKCPHKAVPILREIVDSLVKTQLTPGLRIIGVSGTLRKAFNKFCITRIPQGKDYKA
jgi:RNase P/RNase MRP subunit POP5